MKKNLLNNEMKMETKVLETEPNYLDQEDSRKLSYEMLFAGNESGKAGFNNPNGFDNGRDEELHNSEDITKEQLQQLEAEWAEKLEQAKEEVFRKGVTQGQETGKKEALEQLSQRIQPVFKAAEEAKNEVTQLMDKIKPYMANLVFDLAEKVIAIPVEDKQLRDQVANEINDMLETFDRDIKVKIVLSAEDYEYVSQAVNEDLPDRYIDFRSSDELNPGEYSVDTAHERVVKNFKKILKDFREKTALTAENQESSE